MSSTRGWHKIVSGWYRYTNADGVTLAYAQKYRSFWRVTVLPAGQDALSLRVSDTPGTLREAKAIAERIYKSLTPRVLTEQAAAVAAHQS